jgi:hypothetical protein
MKLARPDVFHPRIVLAGEPRYPGDAGLVAALRTRGLHARWLPWEDPGTVAADLVILRATPEARDRRDEFLAWIRRVRHLLNPPDAVAWNLDEGCVRDLESAGVPTAAGRSEAALIFLGGQRSHAFTETQPVEPEFEVWDVGYAAIAAAAGRAGIRTSELLYARADVGGGRLVALDLVAPSLGWNLLEADARDIAQRRFAIGVESALERLGLGPLSHRRP